MSILKKIILPFSIILIFLISLNVLVSSWLNNKSLNTKLIQKSEIMSKNIVQASTESLIEGSTYELQNMVVAAKESDQDVIYAIIVDSTGLCLANTDLSLMGKILDKTEFEKDVLPEFCT